LSISRLIISYTVSDSTLNVSVPDRSVQGQQIHLTLK
jgi:hypothetical protein